MANTLIEKTANRLVDAFINNKIIAPLPLKFTKKLKDAEKLRRLCESKVNDEIIGFKAAGTGIPVMKKLKEKEPFYASIFKRNFLTSGKKVKINKSTLGIELEVCYLIKKNFFNTKEKISFINISKYISHIAPVIEVVGYRQKKQGITSFGDLCSDFGANVKFLIGRKIKNKKIGQSVNGHTNTVFINPLNSLKFVLNKIRKDKINLDKDFYVFTGSTVGVVPIQGKGTYLGKIDKLGSVKATIV